MKNVFKVMFICKFALINTGFTKTIESTSCDLFLDINNLSRSEILGIKEIAHKRGYDLKVDANSVSDGGFFVDLRELKKANENKLHLGIGSFPLDAGEYLTIPCPKIYSYDDPSRVKISGTAIIQKVEKSNETSIVTDFDTFEIRGKNLDNNDFSILSRIVKSNLPKCKITSEILK
ncbi:MAG: hypothetical protein AB7I27_16705 [Bacteriovoracaceae bacterium]